MIFYLLFTLFIIFALGGYFVCKYHLNINKEKFNRIINKSLKICVIVYCIISLLTILLPNALNLSYSEAEINSLNLKGLAVLKWFSSLAFIVLPLAVFYKNKVVRNIAIYLCPIISIFQIIFYPQLLECFTSIDGRGLNSLAIASVEFKNFMLNATFRSLVFGFVTGLELIIPVVLAFQEKHIIDIKNKRELSLSALVFGLITISCIPISVPQHLFGYTSIIFDAWTLPHIMWIISVISEIVILYFVFRKKEYETKMILLYVLSLSLIMQYNQMFGAISINIERLPLQLCNVGSYLILFVLITKSKKLFDFAVIVNVVGVLFALAMPDLDGEGLFYLYNMHFVLEHTNVLVVPILALLFKIFDRLDKKSLKHFFFGFLIYFLCVFVLGTIFNAVAVKTGNSFWNANYLFMFDKDTAADFLPFLGDLFNLKLTLGSFTFYPLMLIVVYVVFNIICFIVFYAIQLIYLVRKKSNKEA